MSRDAAAINEQLLCVACMQGMAHDSVYDSQERNAADREAWLARL